MEEKKISIIVPAYNIAPYLERGLKSLCEQTYKNIEIIVVNDGSTDGTGEVLARCARGDPRIIPMSQKNGGVTRARLAGIERATGDYIGFLDGDDYAEPDMMETLIRDAETYHADIAHCGYQMVFPDGHADQYYGTKQVISQNRRDGLLSLVEGTLVEPGIWNKLYRTELMAALFTDRRMDPSVRINEDLLMNFILFSYAERTVFRDECKYHYMLRKGSAATSKVQDFKLTDSQRVASLLFQETEGDALLHRAACVRYVRVLIGNAAQTYYPDIARQAKEELRALREMSVYAALPAKERYMALGAADLTPLYRLVRYGYDKLTKMNHKYDVE